MDFQLHGWQNCETSLTHRIIDDKCCFNDCKECSDDTVNGCTDCYAGYLLIIIPIGACVPCHYSWFIY